DGDGDAVQRPAPAALALLLGQAHGGFLGQLAGHEHPGADARLVAVNVGQAGVEEFEGRGPAVADVVGRRGAPPAALLRPRRPRRGSAAACRRASGGVFRVTGGYSKGWGRACQDSAALWSAARYRRFGCFLTAARAQIQKWKAAIPRRAPALAAKSAAQLWP